MRKFALPVLLVAALSVTSAMAATAPAKPAPMKPAPVTAPVTPTVTDGVVKKISAKSETVTLDNKTVYYFPAKFDLSKIKVGEKVAITWTAKGKKDMASKIDAVTG